MSDSAEGPISGFLYQFQKALLVLAKVIEPDGGVSVEDVDDIALHDAEDPEKVLMTYQAKHSLSLSGTTFADTSTALWRTLEIWIEKLEKNVVDNDTIFVCATNKDIPQGALLRKMIDQPFDQVFKEIKALQSKLKLDLQAKVANGEAAPHISLILKKISLAIRKKSLLKTIFGRLKIEVEADLKSEFLEIMRLKVTGITAARQDQVYESFYGWIIDTCYAKWKNSKKAAITKKMFDSKWSVVNSNPQILNAIFRKKDELGTLTNERRLEVKDELFVRQINDIERGPGKKVVLEKAMLDFIHHKIEMSFVVTKGDFTESDFKEFEAQCKEIWQERFYAKVIKDKHTENECNSIAIEIYDGIMSEDRLKFNEGFAFSPSNRYIKNGSFLKLSNSPEIGWRPDWEFKYKING